MVGTLITSMLLVAAPAAAVAYITAERALQQAPAGRVDLPLPAPDQRMGDTSGPGRIVATSLPGQQSEITTLSPYEQTKAWRAHLRTMLAED